MYLGLFPLASTLDTAVLTDDSDKIPTDGSSAPAYRVYGADGLMASGTGTLLSKDPSSSGGTITGATNASPIVITSTGHGLTTGHRVTIAGVGGNTAANGTFTITRVDDNTFSLNSSTGNGAYTSGGTWHVSGLYRLTFTLLGANGYASGENYAVLVSWTISSTTRSRLFTFTVV